MTNTTNDIDALLRMLNTEGWEHYHAAVTALVAERDKAKSDFSEAWRERSEFAKRIDEADAANAALVKERNSLVWERSALRQRVAELEAQLPADPDRDLRERLVCAALTGLCADPSFDGIVSRSAIAIADEALAAMRKGDTNAE